MLSNRIGRFFAWILSVVGALIAVFAISSILSAIEENFDYTGLMLSAMIAIVIAFIHQLNADLFNFNFTDNIVFQTIKRVLLFGVLALAVFFGFILFFENGGGREPGSTLEEIFYCMILPSGFSATLVCILWDVKGWDEEKIPFLGYISLIPSFAIGLIIALLGPGFYVLGSILVAILGVGAIVLLSLKFGLVYGDGAPAKKPKRKPNTGNMPTELYNRLCDDLKLIANRYAGSKYLSYGMRAKISGYAMVYDYSATIYVDLDIYMGGCTATSDWQVKSAAKDALAYQEAQMKKMYVEVERTVNRLLTQYNYNVNFNYGVKPGHSETHTTSY